MCKACVCGCVRVCVCTWRKLSLTFLCQWLRRRAGSPPLSSCIVLSWLQTLPVQPCRGLESMNMCVDKKKKKKYTHRHTRTHRVAHSKINFWNQFLKCNRLQDKGATCVSLYLRICTGRVYSAKCTYCRAWPAFRRSHTAWYKSLQLSGHSQWQSTTVGGKENDNKGG